MLALTSLGLGLAASITGIVGGSLFIAGASVLLAAGVDCECVWGWRGLGGLEGRVCLCVCMCECGFVCVYVGSWDGEPRASGSAGCPRVQAG